MDDNFRGLEQARGAQSEQFGVTRTRADEKDGAGLHGPENGRARRAPPARMDWPRASKAFAKQYARAALAVSARAVGCGLCLGGAHQFDQLIELFR
ncbi:hypothetical protein MACH05_10560 [Qipengyuania nanhaisediminis]